MKKRTLELILIFAFAFLLFIEGYNPHISYVLSDADAISSVTYNAGEPIAILEKFKPLYQKNSDIIGWIKIQNTQIDYPIMFNSSQPEYYLRKNFEQTYSKKGLPFVDDRCMQNSNTLNYIIHGHNMKGSSMFSHLTKYEQYNFYKDNPYIELSSLYVDYTLEIVAVFKSQVFYSDQDTFKYYNFITAQNSEEYYNFVENIKNLSFYETGIMPIYPEALVTFSTCSYHTDNGRFAVVCKVKK